MFGSSIREAQQTRSGPGNIGMVLAEKEKTIQLRTIASNTFKPIIPLLHYSNIPSGA
jgi:hypothetical protein